MDEVKELAPLVLLLLEENQLDLLVILPRFKNQTCFYGHVIVVRRRGGALRVYLRFHGLLQTRVLPQYSHAHFLHAVYPNCIE